jgi:hypothetical protein
MSDESAFDSNYYYGILNLLNTSRFLTLGYTGGSAGPPFETGDSFSSNNWQIFYQESIYFIRNYDHGADVQLAVPNAESLEPQMLNRSGDFGHQWNITARPDGTIRLVNILVGDTRALGLTTKSDGTIVPVFKAEDDSGRWIFDLNRDAPRTSDKMLEDVPGLAVTLPKVLHEDITNRSNTGQEPSQQCNTVK